MNSETIISVFEYLVYRKLNGAPETFWLDWWLQKLAEEIVIVDLIKTTTTNSNLYVCAVCGHATGAKLLHVTESASKYP